MIIILILAILALLLYLVISGGADRIRDAVENGEPAVPSPSASVPPVPDASSSPEPSASSEPTPEPSPAPEPSPTPDPEAAKDDIKSNDSVTKIVSPSMMIDPSYVPKNLVEPNVPKILDENQNLMRADAAQALEKMFAEAEKKGYHLYLVSGYRSYEFQQKLLEYWVDTKGSAYASELDAKPGGSEHQLGLAANIGTTDGKCELNVCFADTGAYSWLIENSWKYGYIERYPSGKQEITGITYSPWNFRYVGTDAAERIHKSGKTMEEYYSVTN